MNQEFTIDSLKIKQEDDMYNVLVLNIDADENPIWTKVASFRSPAEAVRYFGDYLTAFEQQRAQAESIAQQELGL
jgi:hypothetical protein